MKTPIRYGIVLGVAVEIWTAIIIATGCHKDPVLLYLFFLVLPIEATVLVLAIKKTMAAGGSYPRKVATGLGASLVAGVIVFFGSAFLTTIVFPRYFDELRVAGTALLAKQGRSPAEIAAMLKANEPMYSPWTNALQGFVGTMVTGPP
jgi:hypothetical protein